MMISPQVKKTLEFDVIVKKISEFAISPLARDAILQTLPSRDFLVAKKLLSLTGEYCFAINKYSVTPLSLYFDIDESIKRASLGGVLSVKELYRIMVSLRSLRLFRKAVLEKKELLPVLAESVSIIIVEADLEKRILSSIASELEVKSDASKELFSIRQQLISENEKLRVTMATFISNPAISKFLAMKQFTVRNDRFVLPVKSEFRGKIQGAVYDVSDTAATVFIEPFSLLEINNKIVELKKKEEKEIEKILKTLSLSVSSSSKNVKKCLDSLIMLDIVSAKSQYAAKINGIPPVINRNGEIKLIKARHPLIDKGQVVPVDISISNKKKMLLITGSNMGGKTVSLKIVGLFCVMAASGIFIPCEEGSEVSVYNNIFCDIGDGQSIESSLSSFSSHLLNIKSIAENACSESLVLLDEVGSGTDPIEGAAFALGVVKFLEKRGVCSVVTTHYGNLKQYAATSINIENASMKFDEVSLRPTYRLIVGVPGASFALKIAASLGIQEEILSYAKESLGERETSFEEAISSVQQLKYEAQKERDNAKAELVELQQIRIKAKDNFNALLKERELLKKNTAQQIEKAIFAKKQEADKIIEKLTEILEGVSTEKSIIEAKKVRRELEDSVAGIRGEKKEQIKRNPLKMTDIVKGKDAFSISLGSSVKILSDINRKNEIEVLAGSIKAFVRLGDLYKLEKDNLAEEGGKRAEASTKLPAVKVVPVNQEVFLLGKTVSEAIQELEQIILTASSGSELRLVHGKGTGALGRGVQSYLKTNKKVESFRYGKFGEGEGGVTIAILK